MPCGAIQRSEWRFIPSISLDTSHTTSGLGCEELFHFFVGVFEDGVAIAEEEDFEFEIKQLAQGRSELRRVVELVAGDESQETGRMTDEGVSQDQDPAEFPEKFAAQRVEVQGDFAGGFAGPLTPASSTGKNVAFLHGLIDHQRSETAGLVGTGD